MSTADGDTPRARRRTFFGRLALVLGGPIVMLVVLELVLRLFGIDPSHGAFDQRVWLRFDLERVDADLSRPPPGPRLVCLGDSTIHGMPLEGVLSMCTIVGESLGPGTEVVNLSQAGIDSTHVRQMAEVACRHPATLVLLYLGHNEFLNLERFAAGRPGAFGAFMKQVRKLRVYRAIATFAAGPSRGPDFRWVDAHEDEVYAGFEANVRGILDACASQKVVMSTVVSNPAFRFPLAGRTLRQSHRERGPSRAEPTDSVCRHCIRAGPQVNPILRRLAAEADRPIVEAEPLVGPDPDAQFWDHVHPRPDLHLAIAREMLALARKRGWIERTLEPRWSVPEPVMTRARVTRAFDNMTFDPERAARELGAVTAPDDPVLVAVGIGIAGFLTDRRDLMEQGFGTARALVEGNHVLGDTWRRCGGFPDGEPERASGHAPPCQMACMPWCSNRVVSEEEKGELAQIGARLGGPVIGRVLERF